MTDTRRGRYLYGVVEAGSPPVETAGLDDTPVEVVDHGDVAALTTPTEATEVLPRRAALLAHTRVLDEAIAQGPVLPAPFGTVLPDADALYDEVLAARHDALRGDLSRLRDVVELRVRGDYEEARALTHIVRSDREVARLRGRASSHADKVRLGELVTANLRQLADEHARHVTEALRPLARDVAVEDPAGALELPRLSFLMARDDVEAVTATVERLDRDFGDVLGLHVAGPLAPHSFVEVEGVGS